MADKTSKQEEPKAPTPAEIRAVAKQSLDDIITEMASQPSLSGEELVSLLERLAIVRDSI